jgi:hypothetical protein
MSARCLAPAETLAGGLKTCPYPANAKPALDGAGSDIAGGLRDSIFCIS